MNPGSTVRPARSTTVAFFAWPWTWASGPTATMRSPSTRMPTFACGASRLERADPVRPPHQVGRVHGGGLDRLHRGQPPANHMGELFRVPAVRIHAGVRAERDLHAGPHRALEVLALRAADQTLLVD